MNRLGVYAGIVTVGLAGGCESMDGASKQQVGTVAGAMLGGVAGSFFGDDAGKLVAIAIGAGIGGFIGNRIGNALDEADREAITKQTSKALEDADDGETVAWQNPDSGASARITPRDSRVVEKEVAVVRAANVAPPPTLELIGRAYRARADLDVRVAPSLDAQVLAALQQGQQFNAVGKVEGGDWYLVSRSGRSIGYVEGDLVEPTPVAKEQQLRDQPIDLDSIELEEGEVAETVTARTECRTLDLEIVAAEGERDESTFEACKAADGAWELG